MGWRKKTTIGTLIGAGLLVYYGIKKERERILLNKDIDAIPYDIVNKSQQYESPWWNMWTDSLKKSFIKQKK